MPFSARHLLLVALLQTTVGPHARAADPSPAALRDEHKLLAARVDSLAQRTSAARDAMAYQRLAPSAEYRMLRQVADTLRGLAETDLRKVQSHLDAAAKTTDAAVAATELRAAYDAHRRVVAQLRALAGQLDTIRGLEAAGARLARAAQHQLALAAIENAEGRARDRLTDEQTELRAEVATVMKQLGEVARFVPADQRARLDDAEVLARGAKLIVEMTKTQGLVGSGKWAEARARQREHAAELKALAGVLRGPDWTARSAGYTTFVLVTAFFGSQTETVVPDQPDPKVPTAAAFLAESLRDPGLKLDTEFGARNVKDYEWDMPLTPEGRVLVVYRADAQQGATAVNLAYRIVPKGERAVAGKALHPRDDPAQKTFSRLPLREVKPTGAPRAFVRDLGLFADSKTFDSVELLVTRDPKAPNNPAVEVGGRVNFEVSGLRRKLPDGTTARIEVGDTLELYVEILDREKGRTAGYSSAKRKRVVSEYEAEADILRQLAPRPLHESIRALAADSIRLFAQRAP